MNVETFYARPRTRGDCLLGPRPCPFIACRHSLVLEKIRCHGEPVVRDADLMIDTCALDVADRGGATQNELAELLGVTRQRIDQLERDGMRKLRRRLAMLADFDGSSGFTSPDHHVGSESFFAALKGCGG